MILTITVTSTRWFQAGYNDALNGVFRRVDGVSHFEAIEYMNGRVRAKLFMLYYGT